MTKELEQMLEAMKDSYGEFYRDEASTQWPRAVELAMKYKKALDVALSECNIWCGCWRHSDSFGQCRYCNLREEINKICEEKE